jgi:hypothetical protein
MAAAWELSVGMSCLPSNRIRCRHTGLLLLPCQQLTVTSQQHCSLVATLCPLSHRLALHYGYAWEHEACHTAALLTWVGLRLRQTADACRTVRQTQNFHCSQVLQGSIEAAEALLNIAAPVCCWPLRARCSAAVLLLARSSQQTAKPNMMFLHCFLAYFSCSLRRAASGRADAVQDQLVLQVKTLVVQAVVTACSTTAMPLIANQT